MAIDPSLVTIFDWTRLAAEWTVGVLCIITFFGVGSRFIDGAMYRIGVWNGFAWGQMKGREEAARAEQERIEAQHRRATGPLFRNALAKEHRRREKRQKEEDELKKRQKELSELKNEYWERLGAVQRQETFVAAREEKLGEWGAMRLHEEDGVRKRFLQIKAEFGERRHLEDEKHIANFARKNRAQLLADAPKILTKWAALQQDAPLVALLEREAPHLLVRARFYVRALALAETLDAGSRVESDNKAIRRQTFQKVRDKALPEIYAAEAKAGAIIQAHKTLDGYELDEEELGRVKQDVVEKILEGDETSNGRVL